MIWIDPVPQDVVNAGYTQEQNDLDRRDFETYFLPRSNHSLDRRDSTGAMTTSVMKPSIAALRTITHDWVDPTTWYTKSIRVVNEVATDSGDHLRYTLAHINLIDTYHSKITGEDYLSDAGGFVKVY